MDVFLLVVAGRPARRSEEWVAVNAIDGNRAPSMGTVLTRLSSCQQFPETMRQPCACRHSPPEGITAWSMIDQRPGIAHRRRAGLIAGRIVDTEISGDFPDL
ncbi:hypothetical protein [Micromonospora lupini]|uniref:hypothetical protein n=1 Tax=Micromonospora lupini TaxID=285679 RepID=UPI0031CE1AA5